MHAAATPRPAASGGPPALAPPDPPGGAGAPGPVALETSPGALTLQLLRDMERQWRAFG